MLLTVTVHTKRIVVFHYNSEYANAPQRYVIRILHGFIAVTVNGAQHQNIRDAPQYYQTIHRILPFRFK